MEPLGHTDLVVLFFRFFPKKKFPRCRNDWRGRKTVNGKEIKKKSVGPLRNKEVDVSAICRVNLEPLGHTDLVVLFFRFFPKKKFPRCRNDWRGRKTVNGKEIKKKSVGPLRNKEVDASATCRVKLKLFGNASTFFFRRKQFRRH